MGRLRTLSVDEAHVTLAYLHDATQAAELRVLAPVEWIMRCHHVVRLFAPWEEQHRYQLDEFHGLTMGQRHRNVVALLRDSNGLVADNPCVTGKAG